MAEDLRLSTVRLTAKSLTQNFGLPGSEDYRTHPSDRTSGSPDSIFKAMREKDSFTEFDPKELKGTVYSLKNRSIISRWVRDVCAAFNLKSTTLCLAVQLTDRFVLGNLRTLQLGQCQLSAITCVWIAAKFEELDAMLPSLKSLVEVCDGAYTAEQMVDMEEAILSSFRWKVPHTTVNNYLYLYLHMLTHNNFLADLSGKPAAPVADDRLTVKLIKPPGLSEVVGRQQLRAVTMVISHSQPLSAAVPTLCHTLGVTSSGSKGGTIEVYRILGDDVVMAQRLDQNLSPMKQGVAPGDSLYLATSTSAAVFTEREQTVLLRPLNSLMLHICETLLQQTLIHAEFLRIPPFLAAMAVLISTRCLLTPNTEAFQPWSNHIHKTLGVSRTQTMTVCEVLLDKYKNTIESDSASLVAPIVPVHADMRERLLMSLGRKQQ